MQGRDRARDRVRERERGEESEQGREGEGESAQGTERKGGSDKKERGLKQSVIFDYLLQKRKSDRCHHPFSCRGNVVWVSACVCLRERM